MVVVVGSVDRDNEGDLTIAAQFATGVSTGISAHTQPRPFAGTRVAGSNRRSEQIRCCGRNCRRRELGRDLHDQVLLPSDRPPRGDLQQ